jgi:ATP synthase protein I
LSESSKDPHDHREDLSRYGGLGVDLFANTMVGFVIGYLLDRWLGTRPWFMLAGLVLGSAAGLMTVLRTIYEEDKKDG